MKKPKSSLFKTLLQWICIVAIVAIAWVSLSPAPQRHTPKTSVHVKVENLAVVEPVPEPPTPPEHPAYEEAQEPEVKPPAPVVEQPQLPQALPPAKITTGKHPKIALIIDDVGLDVRGSQRAIALPGFVTLSFLPYANHIREQTHTAREEGHELMLHMPMEPMGHDNPGPGALFVNLSSDEVRQRFVAALSSFVGFDGVNNHMGSRFTSDPKGMQVVLDELKPRGLFFLDSRTSPKTVGESMARERGVPTISRDVFLDDNEAATMVRQQLLQTEHVAARKGYAVAIGHPHAVTLQEIEQWLPEAQARGFEFVQVHSLISMPNTAATKPSSSQ